MKKETREECVYREEQVKELLKDRPDLLVKGVFRHSYEEVKQIYEMDIWQDEKYKVLLSPLIWKHSYKDICNILSLPEWNNPRFSALFNPAIWKNSYKGLVEKFKLPYLYDKKYEHLIFTILMNNNCNYRRVIANFNIFEGYHIVNYINTASLVRSPELNMLIIEYLIHNNIPLVVKGSSNGKAWSLNPYLGDDFGRFTKDIGLDKEGLKEYIGNIDISPNRILTNYDKIYSSSEDWMSDDEKKRIIISKAKDFPHVKVETLFKRNISYNQCLRAFNSKLWNDNNRFLLTNKAIMSGIGLIEENLKLFEEYNITPFATPTLFLNSPKLNRAIIEYLIFKNEPLVIMGSIEPIINPLFDYSGKKFESYFGVGYNELTSMKFSNGDNFTSLNSMSKEDRVLILLKKWPYLNKELVFKHNVSELLEFLSLPTWNNYDNLRLLNDVTIKISLSRLRGNIELFEKYNLLCYARNENLASSVNYNRTLIASFIYKKNKSINDKIIEQPINKKDIMVVLRDKPDLICKKLFEYDIEDAIKVLNLPQWELPLFKSMLAPNIWNWSYREIRFIIKFINMRGFKYKKLLVQDFWNASYEAVIEKLSLPYFEEGEYSWLVTPKLFSISNDYISGNIEIYERYRISKYIGVSNLARSPIATEIVLSILNRRREKLVVVTKNGKKVLNPIINCSNSEIKGILGIDLDKIEGSAKVRTK